MEIRYCMTRADAWRSNLFLLMRKTSVLFPNCLLWPGLTTWYTYWHSPQVQTTLSLHSPHVWLLPVVFLSMVCLCWLTTLGEVWIKIKRAYPVGGEGPVSMTALMADFLYDGRRGVRSGEVILVPMKVAWKHIRKIVWQGGDLYFHRKNGHNFVPRTAFADPREAQQFYEQALLLWNAAKHGASVPGEDTAVWPPAPRPGA